MDPRDLPYGAADRFAGAIPAAYPELVDRIKSAILPEESGYVSDDISDGAAQGQS
jgi:hypothetical protein